ncbi:MAG: hypothetical protein M1812_005253 [Candelaria pacifica]|nr:MAG: hypothetical protein M1812_005253 [Candelaria pacifica]
MAYEQERSSSSMSGQDPIPTPPSSPRKRRQALRSSEDTEGTMTISEYLAKSDPYRYGCPMTPRPMPLIGINIPKGSPILLVGEKLRDNVKSIVNAHGIFWRSIGLENRTTARQDDVAVETFVVLTLDVNNESWRKAGRECVEMFEQCGFPSLQFEILNPKKCYIPYMFNFPRTHPVITAWSRDTVGEDITAKVKSLLTNKWCVIGVCMYGRTEDTASPTLLITVRQGAFADWFSIYKSLQSVLTEYHIDGLDVDFTPGFVAH